MKRLIGTCLGVGLLALGGCAQPPAPAAPLQVGGNYFSQRCNAGFYRCDLPVAAEIGSQCACPGLGAPSYGTVVAK